MVLKNVGLFERKKNLNSEKKSKKVENSKKIST